ncbi:MAG: protein kinase [Pirellulales bacterium]|nr:protein kinase [Pirellulales bacterium]
MAPIDEFLDHLDTSQLVPAALVAKLRQRVADARQAVDPRTVGKYLIDHGKLTTWQVNQLLAGRTAFFLGRYRLVDRIGQGGMGVVFKAQHAVMDRVVAIKVLNRSLLSNSQAVARFNREVKTAAALNHPNIIGAYDADAVGNTHFLVMEYAEGCDLNRWLRAHGPFDAAAGCECVRQAAEGLHHAWRQGLVHRDIKPVNLLVTWNKETERPVVKILDMGLARFASESSEDGGLTRVGQTIGTPDYIAPEAAENFKGADIRADLFSLGCTLFKLLTGRLPFAGNNTMEKLLARTKADAPPLSAVCPSAPPELAPVLAKMLARDPADRYQTPSEVIAALTPFAALSTGQTAAVEFLRTPPGQNEPVALTDLEPDADTTLAEFFRDCSAAPAREEITPGDRPAPRQAPPSPSAAGQSTSADEDLELAPIEEDEKAGSRPTTAASAPPASPPIATTGPTAGSKSETTKAGKSESKSKSKKRESSGRASAPVPDLEDLGPLGGGLVDDGLGSPAGDLASDGALLATVGPAISKRKKRPDNIWDSPLLLGAGGTLLFLVIAGAALWWLIGRRDSDAMLTKAMASYRAGNYPAAIEWYAAFLEAFPNHERASLARVWTSLARLRMATTPGTDKGSVAAARQIVPEIIGESAAAEAREELGSILPTLAETLAAAAAREQSTELVDAAREARTLVDDYVPKAQRPGQRLAEIDASLELTSRQIARGSALAQAVAEMRAAAEKGNAESAYATRRQLLKTYPDAVSEASLIAALVAVSAAQQKAVAFHEERKPADTTPLEWPWDAAAILVAPPKTFGTTDGTATPTNRLSGAAVAALAADAVYALDATTGAVRWRRQVGTGNDIWPQPVSAQPDADWLVVDRRRHELWRLAAATGELRWRQSIGTAAAAEPVVVGSTAWLATREGHLLAIDLEMGALARRIDLPQPLETAPVLDPAGKRIYQLGEHSNLYVLSPDAGTCDQVVYLGHEPGAIRSAPVLVSRYLLIAENNRLDDSVLRVLLVDEQGANPKEVQQLPLAGHVLVSPVIVDRACLVVTDLGAVYTFEVNPPDQPTALTKLAETAPTDRAHVTRQFAVRPGQLWIGSDRLTRWDLQLARGKQTPGLVQLEDETFVGPVRLYGNLLIAARHAAGGRGIAVAAVDTDSGKLLWDTRLAMPFVGGAFAEPSGDLLALSNAGELFDIKPADLADGDHIFSAPATTIDATPPLTSAASVVPIGKQLRLYSSGATDGRVVIGGAGNTGAQRLAWLSLPDSAAAVPAVLGTSLLVPNIAGRVLLLDPRRGRELASPFQPPLEAGAKMAWRDPAAWGADRAVLSDQGTNVYLLGIEQQPTPRLTLLREAKAPAVIASPWAVLGDKAVAVDATQQLLSFGLPGLEAAAPVPVPGPVVWGPKVVDDRLFLATATELVCFDAQLQISWQSPLTSGALAGTPAPSTQGLLIASTGGRVGLVSPETGQATWTVELGVPLAGGPVIWGDRFVVAGVDGTLYVVKPK